MEYPQRIQCSGGLPSTEKRVSMRSGSLRLLSRSRLELFVPVHCSRCGYSDFRASRVRLRSQDVKHLLKLRFPVRCNNCGQRSFTSFSKFLKIRREHESRSRDSHDKRDRRVAE
jgi:predicted nucleic-acid-binding Zn-ribbon protein